MGYQYTPASGSSTADNGLTKTGDNIQLGGALTKNTVVDTGAFTLDLGSTVNNTVLVVDDSAFTVHVTNRFRGNYGANVTAANNLTLGNDGNAFTIVGNTQINAITTLNWDISSAVILKFTGTPTVMHNTAGGAGTARIFLAGSVNLVAANNTILGLIFDGIQWQETFRKVA